MANDMNSAINALKGILGDNADEKIQSVMSGLLGGQGNSTETSKSNENTSITQNPSSNNNNLQYMMKIKNIFDEMSSGNDSRSNLLLSLKPYMRTTRQQSIDNAIKIIGLTKLTGLFK